MPNIRQDLFGVVTVNGVQLKAGDEIPDGIGSVPEHIVDADQLAELLAAPEVGDDSEAGEPEAEEPAKAKEPARRNRRTTK